jgi:dGTPase
LTHTLEVSQVARTIARALRLNEDLTEAISLGHDLGHTPFGHAGENVLNRLTGGEFLHNKQSLRMVDVLESDGKGLNLTALVRDGILQHRLSGTPMTLEGMTVSFADRIAYLNHDIDDAIRAGVLTEEDLPRECTDILGNSKGERIETLVWNIVKTSYNQCFVKMSDEYAKAAKDLRAFMFDRVYKAEPVSGHILKAEKLIEILFEYYIEHLEALPAFYRGNIDRDGDKTAVCDYIASMTDRYAIREFERLFVPEGWRA